LIEISVSLLARAKVSPGRPAKTFKQPMVVGVEAVTQYGAFIPKVAFGALKSESRHGFAVLSGCKRHEGDIRAYPT